MSNCTSRIENPDSRFLVSQPVFTQHMTIRRMQRLFASVLAAAAAFSATADQTWVGGVSGSWNNSDNWSDGTVPAATEVAIFNTPGAVVSVDADTTIKMIRVHAPATLTLNSPLHIVNAGRQGTDIRADLVINGPSTLDFSRNGTSTTDLLDLFVRSDATLTVNAKLTGSDSGIETWITDNFMAGTYAFSNPDNDFPNVVTIMREAILSVPSLGPIGSASCLGTGNADNLIRCSNNGGALRITGDSSFTTDRPLYFYSATPSELLLDTAGNGDMTFTGAASSSTETGAKTLRLGGNGTGTKTYAGAIAGSSEGPISLVKQGQSEWRIAGANDLVAITLLQGTLTTANPASLTASDAITLFGGTLRVTADALNADGTFTASPFSINGPATLSLATGNSDVQLPALTLLAGGTLDIVPADGKVFATGVAAGPLAGITVNGLPAVYSATDGITADPAVQEFELPALGPGDLAAHPGAVITLTDGGAGPALSLSADSAVALIRNPSATPAVIELGGHTLTVGQLSATATLTLTNGIVATPAGTLNVTGPVTLHTAFPAGTAVAKSGAGTATVPADGLTSAVITDGALALAVAANTTNNLPALSGNGMLIKTGPGWLALTNANNNFLGDITVAQGTLLPTVASALGYDDRTRVVTVTDGGALDMGLLPSANNCIYVYQLRLAGDGPDGNGALVNNGPFTQYFTQPLIALDADASIGGIARLDVRRNEKVVTTIQPRFELNGYTLTVKGDAKFAPDLRSATSSPNFAFTIPNADVLVADPAAPDRHGTFAVAPGALFRIEFSSTLAGDTNTLVSVSAGGVFDMYELVTPVPWRIQAEAGSAIRAPSGFGRDMYNVITGPVETSGNGDLILTDTANTCSLTLTGPISGPGGITSYGGAESIAYLLASNNTYQGDTTVSGDRHILFAAYPSTIPGWDSGKLNAHSGGLFGIGMGDSPDEGWSSADLSSLIDTVIPADAGIVVDTALLDDPDITIAVPVKQALRKQGPGSLFLDAPIDAWFFNIDGGLADVRHPGPHTFGYTRTYSGSIVITNDAAVTVAKPTYSFFSSGNLYLGDRVGETSLSNRIGGTAFVSMPDIGYNKRQQYFIVGQNGRATLDVTDDALLLATLHLGCNSTGAGAIYQSGNSIVTNTTGRKNDAGLGTATGGYGYYGLESGINHTKGYWQIAKAQNSQGILRQTGGSFIMPGGSKPADGIVGDYYDGTVTLTRGGFGFAFLLGGTFYHGTTLGVGGDGNSGSNTGSGALVVAGEADATVNGPIDLGRRYSDANARNRLSDLVLAGNGRLTANRIHAADNPGRKGVSFNGGTLVCTNSEFQVFDGTLAGHNVVIHEGGFTLEIPAAIGKTIDVPLRAPTGLIAADMTFATPYTDYIAPPIVINKYNGPDGHNGYVAEALFDRPSGAVTGIKFYAPGNDMSPQPIATLRQAGRDDVDVTLSVKPAVSGGFTKTGGGGITFNAANTYTGPTLVREGTLALGHGDALSAATAVTVGGTGAPACLDLRGHDIQVNALTIGDGGTVVNGTLSAASISKTGASTATLAVAPVVAAPPVPALDALTPGLWEGLVSRTAKDPCHYTPKQNIRLTTFAANNGYSANTENSGGMWVGNNHTYAYTGCIWNRTATNQVWNFRGAFDDYVYLVIDRSLVIYRNGNSGPTTGSFTATPGPHFFDARFGDGSGSVGCSVAGMLNSGLNWDPGDGAGWRVIADPGDGSILTTSSVNWDAAEAARNAQPGQPGLFEGTVGGCGNSVEPNPCDSIQLTPRAANGIVGVPSGNNQSNALENGYVWWNYSSAVYSGYVWNRSGETQNWTFIQNIDDSCLIVIDGQTVLSGRLSEEATRLATVSVTPGPHAFELRFGQHEGSAGGSVIPGSGFGIDLQGRHSTEVTNFTIPYAYGNGMPEIYTEGEPFFTTTLNGYVETPAPAVQVEAGTLALLSDLTPGLLFGEVDGYKNWDGMPGETTVDLATSVANVYGSPGHGDTFTLVYSGAIWNRTGQDVTWSFMMDYDDGGRLVIDWTNVVIFAESSCKTKTGTVTLPPGPHAIELRFSENTGGDGPWGGNIPWAVGIKEGAATTTWQDYTMLADSGDGSLLTTSMPVDYSGTAFNLASGATLDLGGGECTVGTLSGDGTIANGAFAAGSVYRVKIDGETSSCVTFNDVDLANLTVMPADAASATPTASTYVIATGAINTKPALSGFPSKYRLIVFGGTQLLLTTQGGAILLLK